jgi:hypothetical protein
VKDTFEFLFRLYDVRDKFHYQTRHPIRKKGFQKQSLHSYVNQKILKQRIKELIPRLELRNLSLMIKKKRITLRKYVKGSTATTKMMK